MGRVLGHVKQSYMFDLLLETRMPHERFMPYKPGGKLRMVPTFVSADTLYTSHKAWFKYHVRAGVDIDAINYTTRYSTNQKKPTCKREHLTEHILLSFHTRSWSHSLYCISGILKIANTQKR